MGHKSHRHSRLQFPHDRHRDFHCCSAVRLASLWVHATVSEWASWSVEGSELVLDALSAVTLVFSLVRCWVDPWAQESVLLSMAPVWAAAWVPGSAALSLGTAWASEWDTLFHPAGETWSGI